MKKTLAVFASFVALFATANAQLVQPDTPPIGTVYSYARTSSGAAYLLTSLPVYQTYFAIPFGLDFEAGWGGVYGQKMNGTEFVGNVFGAEFYCLKEVGQSGAFFKGSLYGVVGDGQRPDYGFALSLGFRF